MSRRESRSSLGARQSNALEEFENFKKKYLLVNKHIAKLNSSLNIRIEELLSQIAVLNNDNLRLRASELSLARKLANEQDRTRRLYKETESASQLLMDQVNSMKIMFGLDRPTNPVTLKTVVAPRTKASRPSQPPINRVARAPEFDMINEAAEEELSPSRQAHRDASSPTSAMNTPTRRRSTGSTATPRSTPASNASMSPDNLPKARNSGEPRKSTPPISMEISNNSSPFSPSPAPAITNQPLPVSPSPAVSVAVPVQKDITVMSPPTVDTTMSVEKGQDGKDKKGQGTSSEEPTSSIIPHLNLFGLKRVSRRPSGLLKGDPLRSKDSEEPTTKDSYPAVSVSIPLADIPKAISSSTAYPTPLSPNPAPCTPPRQPMVLSLSDSEAPLTPGRKLPMSPVLTANPALSPPPAKKLSLTRRQLDFGITESEDEDEARNSDEATLDFQPDHRMGRKGRKRKILEDEEDDLMVSLANKEPAVRSKKQEKRRDTGTVFTALSLKEKGSKGSFSAEGMESKESLRDVTNERSSTPTQPQDTKQMKSAVNGTIERPMTAEAKLEARGHVSGGLAARLQRLESRAQAPLVSPIPLPPPEATQAGEGELEQISVEPTESVNAIDIGRRGSGRVRKSVNYKEPSLVSKMRKPDPTPPPSTSSSARSSGDVVSSVAHRPPKRKKGSVSLVDDILGSGASSTTATPNSNPESSKVTSEGDRVRSLTEGLLRTRRSALDDDDLDLSSSDEELQKERDGQFRSTTESGIGYTSSANHSRTSFSRGLSILAKGSNPIISSASSGLSAFPTLTSLQPGATARIKDPTVGPLGRTQATDDTLGNEREGTDVVAT